MSFAKKINLFLAMCSTLVNATVSYVGVGAREKERERDFANTLALRFNGSGQT